MKEYWADRKRLVESLSLEKTGCYHGLQRAITWLNLPRIANEVAGEGFWDKNLITFSRALGVMAFFSAVSLMGANGLEEQVTLGTGAVAFGMGALVAHVEGVKVGADAMGASMHKVVEKIRRNPGALVPGRPCNHADCRSFRRR